MFSAQPDDHDRRKGKWTLKLLAAHFIYMRVSGDSSTPTTSALCSAVMDKIMSTRVLGRMAIYWKVVKISSIREAVFDKSWSPQELDELTKAHIYHYSDRNGLDLALTQLLNEYFEECFVLAIHTTGAVDKKTAAIEIEELADWPSVYMSVLKELRLVTAETQSLPEGWLSVPEIMRRVSKKHPAVQHAQPAHFLSRVMDFDAMLKLQSLKRTESSESGFVSDAFYLRATYCHRDHQIAADVLASHVRVGAVEGKMPTHIPLFEFLESTKKLDTVRAQHGLIRMVPFRPFLLFPESRAVAIRRRCVSEESFAKVNKIKLNDSAFAVCDAAKLANLIITSIPRGETPPSHPAADEHIEEVKHQYHAMIHHELKEVERGLVVSSDSSMRCHALIPISFGENIPHMFPALTTVKVPTFDANSDSGFVITHGVADRHTLRTPSDVPPTPQSSVCGGSDFECSSASSVALTSPEALRAAPSTFADEISAVTAWLEETSKESLVLEVSPTSEKKALSRIRSLLTPIIDSYNKASNAQYTVVMGDSVTRPDLTSLISTQKDNVVHKSKSGGSSSTLLFFRAPSPQYCTERLAKELLGEDCLEDGSMKEGKKLCLLLEKVLHSTKYELLEFLGDAVIDYITAFRKWDAHGHVGGDNSRGEVLKAAAVGQEVNRETNNFALSSKLPLYFRSYLRYVMGRTVYKHYADAYEAIVGAIYLHQFETKGSIKDGLSLAQQFVYG